jgi:hypothetical protein
MHAGEWAAVYRAAVDTCLSRGLFMQAAHAFDQLLLAGVPLSYVLPVT